jgi:hypothetical protein
MDDDLIELVAPGGIDEANVGAERYRVDNNGRISVPREKAFWLIRAGFKPVPATSPQPAPAAAPAEDGDGASPSPRVGPPRPRKGVTP